MTTYAIPDCGICSQPHRCHSPHLKSWCSVCCPTPETAVANLIARRVAEIDAEVAAAGRVAPLPLVSRYAQREGWRPAPIRQRMPRPA